jgi:hypothetical protein
MDDIIIKVGKISYEKLLRLEKKFNKLGYRFISVEKFDEIYYNGLYNYGELLCYRVDEDGVLAYSSIDYYEKLGYNNFISLDDFLKSNSNTDKKYIVAKLKYYNREYYEVLKLEDGCYVSFSEYQWKEKSWAESELEVREKADENCFTQTND